MGPWAICRKAEAAGAIFSQLIDTSEQWYYAKARPMVDWSAAELLRALPELRGLKAAESQEKLFLILDNVGEVVDAFFKSVPNTSSIEVVRQERLRSDGRVVKRFEQEFSYLVLTHLEKGMISLKEYRTDTKGNPVEPHGLEAGFMLTQGFATLPVCFHPSRRSESTFRFLGEQVIDGQESYVVAFAQRPGWVQLPTRVTIGAKSVLVLLQGIAWIHRTSYRIIRLRTELLAPRPDVKLERQTTEVHFGEVHFEQLSSPLWLPREVILTSDSNGQTFRNHHRYSDFKLFTVESKIKTADPTPQIPQNPN